jgi:hypothetical protein
LPRTSANSADPGSELTAFLIICESRSPLSVTTSGLAMPSSAQAAGSSAMRPGPDHTRVG